MNEERYITPENCPLCSKPNNCGNLSNMDKACWCMDLEITFPESLLNQVPDAAQNSACICKSCAFEYKNDSSQ